MRRLLQVPRTRPLLALAALALLAFPAQLLAQGTSGGDVVTVNGRVINPVPGGLPGLPCCDVRVTLDDGNPFTPLLVGTGKTRSDGTFSVEVPCAPVDGLFLLTTEALCCGATGEPMTLDGCLDPLTGEPRSVDAGDLDCSDPPQTNASLLHGQVLCRESPFLEPVGDCPILISDVATGRALQFTRTDANGLWEVCLGCDGTLPPPGSTVLVEAQCCGLEELVTLVDCPESQAVETMVCTDCPVPPCPDAGDVEVTGRVVCGTPGGVTGVPDCLVRVTSQSSCTMGESREDYVRSDSEGYYTLCLPCEAEEGCATWTILTQPECCANGAGFTSIAGCEPRIQLPDNVCPEALGCPPGPKECPPGERTVSGRVSCDDPLGGPGQPRAGCVVEVSCNDPTTAPVTATTDSEGFYSVCFPCSCDVLMVRALCCASEVVRTVRGCQPETVDLDCGPCEPGTEPRPCAMPPGVLASGVVTCLGGREDGAPLAGCSVELTPLDVTGAPLPVVLTETDGSGRYETCLPCGPNGLAGVEARSLCCEDSNYTETGGEDCPRELELSDLGCEDCSPCPDEMTRLQGKVKCRHGGAVADCEVHVTVPFCDGSTRRYTTTTDNRGRYALCVPCPCERERIRVTSSCCDATKTRKAKKCRKTTPLPTLHCKNGCGR